MTSKCGKRKKYGTRGGTECVAHVPTTFFNMYDLSTDPRQQGIFLFYARKKNTILLIVMSFMCLSFEISLLRTIKMH